MEDVYEETVGDGKLMVAPWSTVNREEAEEDAAGFEELDVVEEVALGAIDAAVLKDVDDVVLNDYVTAEVDFESVLAADDDVSAAALLCLPRIA